MERVKSEDSKTKSPAHAKLAHTIGRDEEREFKLRIANTEIDELRYGLKYAEL
jgi:hypothetical protein